MLDFFYLSAFLVEAKFVLSCKLHVRHDRKETKLRERLRVIQITSFVFMRGFVGGSELGCVFSHRLNRIYLISLTKNFFSIMMNKYGIFWVQIQKYVGNVSLNTLFEISIFTVFVDKYFCNGY